MPSQVTCPFCKGCGRIQAEQPPRVPRGWVTLPVLAAQVGLSHGTVHKHMVAELLHAQWGQYRRGRGNRQTMAYFVSPPEKQRYKSWLATRHGPHERYRTTEYARMLDAGESHEVIAAKFGIKAASVRTFAARRRKRLGGKL